MTDIIEHKLIEGRDEATENSVTACQHMKTYLPLFTLENCYA